MDFIEIKPEEDCQEQCGTIYLTSSGILVIHCTLCENKYDGYDEYATHIEEHIAPDFFGKEIGHEFIHTDDSEIISPDQIYENNTSTMPEYGDVELTLEEAEDIFELEFEKTNHAYELTDEDSSTRENFLEVERLDEEEIGEENTLELPISVKIKVNSDPAPISEKRTLPQHKSDSKAGERNHKCPHCDFSCNDRSNLLGHIKRHSNNKPHKCTDCSKCFYTRTELKAHIRSHTGERPYLCTECGKAFGTSSKLSLHLKRHANIRDKECPLCDMKFYSTTRLRDHMMIHSEDRPLKCDMCESSFKAYSSLKNHRKLHENERKYKCSLCPASFNQNPGLYSHMKKRHSVVKNMESSEKELKVESEES